MAIDEAMFGDVAGRRLLNGGKGDIFARARRMLLRLSMYALPVSGVRNSVLDEFVVVGASRSLRSFRLW